MAILTQGILGPVTGRTGPVVSYIRFGKNITRSLSNSKRNKIETPARKMQRQKIKVCNEFTKAFTGTGFFNKSFPAYGNTGSGYNRATSAIMNLAIVSHPETTIAWPKVLISKGPVASVDVGSASINEAGNIVFTWIDNTGTGTAKGNDKAILVAYFPESKEAVYQFSDATRNAGWAILEMNSKKGVMETWLGFLSADEKNAANSVYTGKLL
ncbi:MAG TPA: DUF6266 family protein [Chitinophagaceae bacterium]